MVILKSFVMSLSYIPNEKRIKELMMENNCDEDEAINFDYEKNWKNNANLFAFQTRTVLALYTRFFPKYKTSDCKGIVVECVEKITNSRILDFTGIYTVQVEFDFWKFSELSEYEKKKKILDTLKKGLDIVIEEKQWDKGIFNVAYQKVIESDYINEWYWKKSVKNHTKEYCASVFCEHALNSFDISIIITNKRGDEIKRVKVISEMPDKLVYNIHLGQLKWVSDNTVSLINEFGTKQWSVKIE